MSTESGTRPSTSGSAMRLSFAQSTASSTRSATSSGQRRCSSSSSMNAYSPGSGASPTSTITLSLPSWSTASLVASSEPRASPSGFSWVTSRKRSFERSASATACRSLVVCVWGELIDQLGHADPALDRRIVFEGQLGSPLHSQLSRYAGLQDAVRRREPVERIRALGLRAEHADEDTRMPEVGRGLDTGDRDEPDPSGLQVADGLRDDLPDGFVDSTHAVTHSGYSSGFAQLGGGSQRPR